MRRLLFSLIGLLSLPPAASQAFDTQGQYAVLGSGTALCSTYSQARQAKSYLVYAAWLTGYLTARNMQSDATYDLSSRAGLEGMLGWLDTWCKANPTRQFAAAAYELTIYLYPSRTVRAPR